MVARLMKLSATLLAFVASGCLLASAPDSFPCDNQSHCHDDERCRPWGENSRRICTPASECLSSNDCDRSAACVDGTCVGQ